MLLMLDTMVECRTSKADILAAMQELKADIKAGTIYLDVDARGIWLRTRCYKKATPP